MEGLKHSLKDVFERLRCCVEDEDSRWVVECLSRKRRAGIQFAEDERKIVKNAYD